jgi:hypothetical protein
VNTDVNWLFSISAFCSAVSANTPPEKDNNYWDYLNNMLDPEKDNNYWDYLNNMLDP